MGGRGTSATTVGATTTRARVGPAKAQAANSGAGGAAPPPFYSAVAFEQAGAAEFERVAGGLEFMETLALGNYKGNFYGVINQHLRGTLPYAPEPAVLGIISRMDDVFEYVRPTIPFDVMLRREVSGDFYDITEAAPGTEFVDKGFASSARVSNADEKTGFGRVAMLIHFRAGQVALALDSQPVRDAAIKAGAVTGQESEVLIPRGTRFRVEKHVAGVVHVSIVAQPKSWKAKK